MSLLLLFPGSSAPPLVITATIPASAFPGSLSATTAVPAAVAVGRLPDLTIVAAGVPRVGPVQAAAALSRGRVATVGGLRRVLSAPAVAISVTDAGSHGAAASARRPPPKGG